jgi:hypothetical protein
VIPVTDVPAELAIKGRYRLPLVIRDSWRGAVLNGLGALLGILIAFSINAWWSDRSERLQEKTYLQALRAELVVTRADLAAHSEAITRRGSLIQHYLKVVVAADPRSASTDSINHMLSQLGPYWDFVPRRAALDDLLSSGGLQLIRSDSLRRALAAYEQALSLDRAAQEGANAFWRTQQSPHDVTHGSLHSMLPYLGYDAGGLAMFGELPFDPDPDAYYGNRTYANVLISRFYLEGRVDDAHQRVLVSLVALLEFLGGGVPG